MEEPTKKTEDPRLTEIKKKFNGSVYSLIVPLDMEEDETTPNRKVATFFIKRPDAAIRKMMQKLSNGPIPERAVIAGIQAMRLGGDEVSLIENNYDALISAEEGLSRHLSVYKAELKKN